MSISTINLPIFLILFTIVGVLLGLLFLVIGMIQLNRSRNTVATRLENFVLNREKPKSTSIFRQIIPREISGSFINRTVRPFFQNIFNFFGRFTPGNSLRKIEHRLIIAGNPMGIQARAFSGIRVLFVVVGFALAVLINYMDKQLVFLHIFLGAIIILYFYYLPGAWLTSRVRQRQEEFRRTLPDGLDLLSVCVSAGMGFDQSLAKISENWPTPLGKEFSHVNQEMEIGVSRAEALRNMSRRLDVEEISSFVSIIIQAESIGMSFADVLHSQAEQMRVLRIYRAKETANKIPAKLIIPLALLIFPALIAVILGPMIPTFLAIFSSGI